MTEHGCFTETGVVSIAARHAPTPEAPLRSAPGKALIMTAILALIMIYILAFLAFNSFYTKFEHNPNFGEGYDCSSMLKCVLVHLVYGLRYAALLCGTDCYTWGGG